jgi:hypothetical protein
LTVNVTVLSCVTPLLAAVAAANVSASTVAATFCVTVTVELMVMLSLTAGMPPGPEHPLHVAPELHVPLATALQSFEGRMTVLPSTA